MTNTTQLGNFKGSPAAIPQAIEFMRAAVPVTPAQGNGARLGVRHPWGGEITSIECMFHVREAQDLGTSTTSRNRVIFLSGFRMLQAVFVVSVVFRGSRASFATSTSGFV